MSLQVIACLYLSLHVFSASCTSVITINLTGPALTRLNLYLHATSSTSHTHPHTHDLFQLVRPAFEFKAAKPSQESQDTFSPVHVFACALARLVRVLCNGISGDSAAMSR